MVSAWLTKWPSLLLCHCIVELTMSLSLSCNKEKYETKKHGISNDINDTETYLTPRGWAHHLSGWCLPCLLIVVVVVVVAGTLTRGPGC